MNEQMAKPLMTAGEEDIFSQLLKKAGDSPPSATLVGTLGLLTIISIFNYLAGSGSRGNSDAHQGITSLLQTLQGGKANGDLGSLLNKNQGALFNMLNLLTDKKSAPESPKHSTSN